MFYHFCISECFTALKGPLFPCKVRGRFPWGVGGWRWGVRVGEDQPRRSSSIKPSYEYLKLVERLHNIARQRWFSFAVWSFKAPIQY